MNNSLPVAKSDLGSCHIEGNDMVGSRKKSRNCYGRSPHLAFSWANACGLGGGCYGNPHSIVT